MLIGGHYSLSQCR